MTVNGAFRRRLASVTIISVLILVLTVAAAFGQTPGKKKVHLAVWAQFVETGGPQPNLEQLLREFSHPDIEVELSVIPGQPEEHAEKILVMLATLGEAAPDLFVVEPKDATTVYGQGVALDLRSFLDNDPAFAEEVLFVDEFNGGIYGIPGSIVIQPLAYNAEAVDAAGLVDPNQMFQAGEWNQEVFAQYATRVTQRVGNADLIQIGFMGTATSPFNEWPFIWNFGGRVTSPDGKRALVNSEETIAAYEWMVDQVIRDALVIADFEPTGTYERRNAGDVVFGQGSPTLYHLGLFPYLPEFVPQPSGPAGRHSIAALQPWIIHAGSQHPEAAWEVLKFIVAAQSEYQMHRLGAIPNQRSLVGTHILLQSEHGQQRTPVEAVWNETMFTLTPQPRYLKPEVYTVLTQVTLDVLGGKIGADVALPEAARQLNAILSEL